MSTDTVSKIKRTRELEAQRDAAWAEAQTLRGVHERNGGLLASEQRKLEAALKRTEEAARDVEHLVRNLPAESDWDAIVSRSASGLPLSTDAPTPVSRKASTVTSDMPFLTRSQSFSDYVKRAHPGREDGPELRLGAMLRGFVLGDWEGAEAEQRVMNEGTGTAGGFAVPTPLAGRFIDRARNATRVLQAGGTTVPMTSQTLKVPRLTGSSAPAWRNENAAIAEGDLTIDNVTLTARSMSFLVKVSRELLEDSDPSVQELVTDDLAKQVALEWDRVALRGTGTAPQPRGILSTSGVTVTTLGTGNGLRISTGTPAPSYDPIMDLFQEVRARNFEPGDVILNPGIVTALDKARDATTGQYIGRPTAMEGHQLLATNQVPINLTVGTSTDCTEIYTGEWNKLYLGLRTGPLQFTLDQRYAENGQVAFLIWFRGDIALAQPGAFAVATGARV